MPHPPHPEVFIKDAKGCFVKRNLTYFWLFSLWGGGREKPAFTFMKRENQRQSQHARSEGVWGVAPGKLLVTAPFKL